MDQPKNRRGQNAHEYAGRKWKIKREIIPLDSDVAGQFSQEGDLCKEYEEQAKKNQDRSAQQKELAKIR